MRKRVNGTVYEFGESMTEDEADFSFLELSEVELNESEFGYCNFSNATFENVNFDSSTMYRCVMVDCAFVDCDFTGATFDDCNLTNAVFRDCILSNATFKGSNLQSAEFIDCSFSRTDFADANLIDTHFSRCGNLEYTTKNFYIPKVFGEISFGAMTGPLLKLNKVNLPMRAAEFKRLYPIAFDKLKADTGGRDFTESVKDALIEKYKTPFIWTVIKSKYHKHIQRHAITPDELLTIAIDPRDYAEEIGESITDEQVVFLNDLNREISQQNDKHPRAYAPLFLIGWVRYHQDDKNKLLMIEEIQSDLGLVRDSVSADEAAQPEPEQAQEAEDAPTRIRLGGPKSLATRKQFKRQLEYVDVPESQQRFLIDFLAPAAERFYTDAIGIVMQYASDMGYTVEMLSYADKKDHKAPSSVYSDIPRKMGLTAKRQSQADMSVFFSPPRHKVSYYTPNPRKGNPRYRR